VALAMFAALSGACVKPDAPGVAIDKRQSDIVFQAAAASTPTAPEGVANVAEGPVQPSYVSSDVEFEFPPEAPASAAITTRPSVPTVSFRAASTCPDAALNEFPDEPTPLNVPLAPEPRLPKEGLYRWKKGGEAPSPVGPLAVTGFERRVIQNVQLLQRDQQIEAGGNVVQREGVTFRFEMLQPDLRTGTPTLTTYVVKTNGQAREQDPPVEEIGSGTITAGEPERGVVIEKIESLDGTTRSTFEPQTGLLLLPLRVRAGEKFRSVAVDPKSGQTLTLDGEVKFPQRIDACGEILEGWRVDSVLQSSTSDTPIKYSYVIAPQFGAVLIAEEVERQSAEGTSKLSFSVAQKDPSAVTPQEEGN
jgi:hypothetical protein